MDNVTHGLLGAAIGMVRRRDREAPLLPPSATDKAVVLGAVLAAEAPDIDVFFGRGPMAEYIYHRGLTHSLIFAPAIALAATVVVKLIFREARVKTVYGWSLLSVLVAHLINDWMTGWGTRLLFPFSQARLGLDWVPIVDLWYTVPLLVGVLIGWRRPAIRRKAVGVALLYLLIYTTGYRGTSQFLVKQAVLRQYAGQPVSQLRISPNMFNPVAWDYTAGLPDRYEQGRAYPFMTPGKPVAIPKHPEDDVTRAVRSAPELQPYFAQFPFTVIRYEKTAQGYTVNLGDVRYQLGGRGVMGMRVLLNSQLQVTQIGGGGR